jgi:hypothetical protein
MTFVTVQLITKVCATAESASVGNGNGPIENSVWRSRSSPLRHLYLIVPLSGQQHCRIATTATMLHLLFFSYSAEMAGRSEPGSQRRVILQRLLRWAVSGDTSGSQNKEQASDMPELTEMRFL